MEVMLVITRPQMTQNESLIWQLIAYNCSIHKWKVCDKSVTLVFSYCFNHHSVYAFRVVFKINKK